MPTSAGRDNNEDSLNLTASMQKSDRIDPPGYPCIEFIAGPL